MKTITLSDAAYDRLKSWKEARESFSEVVLRRVPKRGTAEDMQHAFSNLPALTEDQARILEAAAGGGYGEAGA